MTPQQPQSCSGCPLYGVGTGFVLGDGDPTTAKVALILEAPGKEELIYDLDLTYFKQAEPTEIARRRLAYPDLEDRFIKRGKAVVGKAGAVLFNWGLAPVGLTRNQLFIDNTLRCLPPKEKGANYPTGNIRKKAEAFCRQYDRIAQFNPTVSLVQIHPAAVAREVTPLPLMIKTFEKAAVFAAAGERPVVLCGGKAVHNWLGYGSTVQTWLGHIQPETDLLRQIRQARFEENIKLSTTTVKKAKKLTAKTALQMLLSSASPELIGTEGEVGQRVSYLLTEAQFKEMAGLCAPKPKKAK